MKFKLFFTALLCVYSLFTKAQNATIHGYVEDVESKERLIGANIYLAESLQGTTSNNYGFYSLTLPVGTEANIVFSYIGYQNETLSIKLTGDTAINTQLNSSIELKTVEIVAEEQSKVHEETQMSAISIPVKMVERLPVLLGEKDILKTLQLLPGVQSGGEGSSGLYVRGGGPDQNLLLLDGVPIYNASHLFGFFSIFSPEAVSNINLVKGGFPARYGGRLSSVVDVRLKEGNQEEFHGEATVGLVSSKLTLQGPIVKNKSSFIVSGRRTYIDLLARPIIKASSPPGTDQNVGYFFHDVTAKFNYKFSESSRLYLSGYLGDDKAYSQIEESYQGFKSEFDSDLQWGNRILALRWNQIISNKLFANATLTYSRYKFNISTGFQESQNGTTTEDFGINYGSFIEDFSAKIDFDYIPNTQHYIKFGVNETYHQFLPGVTSFNQSDPTISFDTTFGAKETFAHEIMAYVEDDFKVGGRLKFNLGLHGSAFIVDESNYFSLQPRVSGLFSLNDVSSLKGSFSTMTQFIHLLTNSTVGLPTDLWVPSTDIVEPQRSWQAAIGYAHTLSKGFEFTVEGYYKEMDNLLEYQEGASFFGNNEEWDQKVLQGEGKSYGVELFLQRKSGRMSGWVGYTLSWSNRTFDELNFGKTYPYKYDRRHDVSVALNYQINDKWDAGLVFVYGTGNAISLGTVQYLPHEGAEFSFSAPIEYFPERNNFRVPSYHRLDIGFNKTKEKKWGEAVWSYGIYNIYNRLNPFYLYWEESFNDRELRQISLFPIIPSISYTAKF